MFSGPKMHLPASSSVLPLASLLQEMKDLTSILSRKLNTSLEEEGSKRVMVKEMVVRKEIAMTELEGLSTKVAIAIRDKNKDVAELDKVIAKLKEELAEIQSSSVR